MKNERCPPVLFLAVLLAAAGGLSACGDAEQEEVPKPQAGARDLSRARTAISAYVAKHASESKYDEMVVTFDGTPVDLTPPLTIDVERGYGHGNSFNFLRLVVHVEETDIERVTWRGTNMRRKTTSATVKRTQVPTAAVGPVLDLVRALSVTKAERRRKPDAPFGWSSSCSTLDFFVLVRVLDATGEVILEKEYAGYGGSSGEATYLTLLAVTAAVGDSLEGVAKLQPVAVDMLRTSHFSNAYARNLEYLLEDFHSWVMEHGLEALAHVGNPEILDTLTEISVRYPSLLPRQQAKLDLLLGEPETYLAGPPKDLPE